MQYRIQAKGFSLIELLVVVALLGVVAGVVLLALNPLTIQKRSRDARRKADLEAIRQALELYRADNGEYPASSFMTDSLQPQPWIAGLVPDYISELPVDPINNGAYRYTYLSITACGVNAGDEYLLYAALESDSSSSAYSYNYGSCTGTTSYYLVEEP